MKLLVGLGNPGTKYARNRHNVGCMAVDRIAARFSLPGWRRRFEGEFSEGEIDGLRTLLLKPTTYMNESGRSVGEAVRFLKIPLNDVVVMHDELDLMPGRIRVKVGGGNAGHNGLRSISAHIGNEYTRLRIGIGHPGSKDVVQHWVLHDFARSDAEWLDPLLDAVAAAVPHLLQPDAGRFQSEVARLLQPEPPARKPKAERGVKEKSPTGPEPPAAEKPKDKPETALANKLMSWLLGRRGG